MTGDRGLGEEKKVDDFLRGIQDLSIHMTCAKTLVYGNDLWRRDFQACTNIYPHLLLTPPILQVAASLLWVAEAEDIRVEVAVEEVVVVVEDAVEAVAQVQVIQMKNGPHLPMSRGTISSVDEPNRSVKNNVTSGQWKVNGKSHLQKLTIKMQANSLEHPTKSQRTTDWRLMCGVTSCMRSVE